ncbi:MAG: ribonuclease P protein component [Candidatus Pacebacteria bacterium]|nr:ribonuclease P protein component [Candidatus Paceibacterota bacterium]
MFPKENRFNSRLGDEFFANAKRVYSPLFVLYYQQREDEQVKATVIVPKKHASKATERTKIKRKMRNSLSPHLDKLEGLSLVLYLKRSVTEKNDSDFEKEITYLLKKFKK